jgi:16S rRNA (guanine527-N7)-methyltransferase
MTISVAGAEHDELERRLEHGVEELGLRLDPAARRTLLQHLALIEKWNRVHNLTAVRDATKAVDVHLLDSLAVVPYLKGKRFLDAGSGAGFPGIPIAVAKPDIRMALLESSHKKSAFLKHAIAELQLRNAHAVCERVESWHPAEAFDCILSRALAELAELITLTGHLLAPGGVLAAMKGVFPFEEIERVPPEFRVRKVHALAVPGLAAERHLVLIERA